MSSNKKDDILLQMFDGTNYDKWKFRLNLFPEMKEFNEVILYEQRPTTITEDAWKKKEIKENENPTDFFNKFEKQLNELKNFGKTVTGIDKLNYLLLALPETLSHIVDIVDVLPQKDESVEYGKLVKAEGIYLRTGPPHTHELNGIVERYNRTIMNRARCLLNEAKIDKSYWLEILEECRSSKLDSKAVKGILVGYTDTGYKILINNKVIISRHVRFIEKHTKYIRFQGDECTEDTDEHFQDDDSNETRQKQEIPSETESDEKDIEIEEKTNSRHDLLICGSDKESIQEVKSMLCQKSRMKDLEHAKQYLGIEIEYYVNEKKMILNQQNYIESIAEKYGVKESKNFDTPMEVNLKLEPVDNVNKHLKYRNLIRALLHIANGIRPNISFSVNYLSRYQNSYSNTHFKYALRVPKYVYCTRCIKLTYESNFSDVMDTYVDADWSADTIDRKSAAGVHIRVYGYAVLRKSQKQKIVSRASTHAEYYALVNCVEEVTSIKGVLTDLGVMDQYGIGINTTEEYNWSGLPLD
ncbi:hypothetical protein ILUMI_24805 [Ignelater luminosus]|uniref:Polyprotein n=1 Tax=Ignelater luminosus TaxID=2038154 RepID=A0A8K0CBS9_IGNLU|nr:hypothetical protein ILUMI_24805 [Ignelater luminosus]